MDESTARAQICAKVAVSSTKVAIAKAIVARSVGSVAGGQQLVDEVLKANDLAPPAMFVLHSSVDQLQQIKAAAEWLSWQMAAAEALWSLLHSGHFLYGATNSVQALKVGLGWTTVAPGGGSGSSSGWSFDEFAVPIPASIRVRPSAAGVAASPLMDPDVYLHTMSIDNMDADVRSALAEAVRCFRFELYTAAVAMLGKASEGAWMELGRSMLARCLEAAFKKQRADLDNPMIGTVKKIETIVQMFEHKEFFEEAGKASGVSLQQLRHTALWSDSVRDSRNTIHFEVEAATPNTYDKVANLLMCAVQSLRRLYGLKAAVDAQIS